MASTSWPTGAPLSDLEAKLLPLYLHHRYQLTAAVKTLGGVRYTYAVKDGQAVRPSPIAAIEPAERQRVALDAVLETLDLKVLVLPDRLLDLIPPQAFNRPDGTAERFTGKTGLVFDPVAAAVTAADFAVSGLLNPQRAARLVEAHARDPKAPTFGDVVVALVRKCWDGPPAQGRGLAVAQAVQWLVVTRLIGVAGDETADPRVRAVASVSLKIIADREERQPAHLDLEANVNFAHELAVVREIRRFLGRPDPTIQRPLPAPSPAGDPIGGPG